MNKKLKVTYVLKTNQAQYQYLKKEVEKTVVMYESIVKEKQRCQSHYEEQQKVKGYAKRFLPGMSKKEIYHMATCIQNNCKQFQCEQILDQRFVWRGVSLFQMMCFPYAWMKQPILDQWKIKNSRLFEKNGKFYLHIVFLEEEFQRRH